MTVSSTLASITYTATGAVNEVFAIPFLFFANSDIHISTIDTITGAVTPRVLDVDYTLSGAGNPAGGQAVWIGASPITTEVQIDRWVDPLQADAFPMAGPFPSPVVEGRFDRVTMMIQQILARMGGSAYDAGALEFLHRASDDAFAWEGQFRRGRNFDDPIDTLDLVNKRFLDAHISSAGNVVAPLIGEVGFVYVATGAGTHAWANRGVPVPANPADNLKLLQANAGAFSWQSVLTVPSPGAGDINRVLRATGVGTIAWADRFDTNLIINGEMRIAQQGTSFTSTSKPPNSDDTYTLDQFILLSDGNNIVDVAQDRTTAPPGMDASLRSTVVTDLKKWGFLQPIEQRDARTAIGLNVSLSLWAKSDGAAVVRNLRAAVISWSGAADAITSDVISAWAGEGVNPTLVANWTFENVAVNLPLTANWQQFLIENIAVDTVGTNNIGVLFWVDDGDAAIGDKLWVSGVQLEVGAKANTFGHRAVALDRALCERYLARSYDDGVAIETAGDFDGSNCVVAASAAAGGASFNVRFPTCMRIPPHTVTTYNPQTGTAGQMRSSAGTDHGTTVSNIGQYGCRVFNSGAVTDGAVHTVHVVADARL